MINNIPRCRGQAAASRGRITQIKNDVSLRTLTNQIISDSISSLLTTAFLLLLDFVG